MADIGNPFTFDLAVHSILTDAMPLQTRKKILFQKPNIPS